MLKARHETGLVFFPAYDWEISPTHPERQERLLYTQDQILEEGLLDIEGLHEFKAGLACEADINRVHFCVPDVAHLTTTSHFISAGGCIEAARHVLDGEVERAFALVRPPGHHAMRVAQGGRGFCNINIEAVMVEWIRQHYPRIKRIAIVDTDCHHGDGTQDIYWHDPDVLYISLHQDGRTLYPGTGFPGEEGGPGARALTLNLPLAPGSSDEVFLLTVNELIRPVLDEFQPDLVINSAGQDNHYSDPITNMAFSAGGYARLTELLRPDICVLEGGYSIEQALPYVNTGIILALAGLDYSYLREPDFDPFKLKDKPQNLDYTKQLCRMQFRRWRDRPGRPTEAKLVTRQRNIYYDTDSISENQDETIRLCPKCPGTIRIDSSVDYGQHALCIHLPRQVCADCRAQAQDWLDKAGSGFSVVYFQDQERDEFIVRKR